MPPGRTAFRARTYRQQQAELRQVAIATDEAVGQPAKSRR